MEPMYCEECHRIERDALFLDTETCSRCGGNLHGLEDAWVKRQPDERQEWHDFDPEC